jgi:hypothetical protein
MFVDGGRMNVPLLLTATLLALPGCLRTWHQPVCEEESVTEVADDEETDAGTARALLDRIAFAGPVDGTWQDGSPAEVELDVRRGAGAAEWVVLRHATEITRSLGFGASYPAIHIFCDNHLRVPVDVDVETADGELAVAVSPSVQVTGASAELPTDGRIAVYGTSPFAEAVLPEPVAGAGGEQDPAAFEGKRAFVTLDYDEVSLVEGAAGWEGEQETPEYHMTTIERLVTFIGPE